MTYSGHHQILVHHISPTQTALVTHRATNSIHNRLRHMFVTIYQKKYVLFSHPQKSAVPKGKITQTQTYKITEVTFKKYETGHRWWYQFSVIFLAKAFIIAT